MISNSSDVPGAAPFPGDMDSKEGLTQVGAKTVEIYQKQMELADRVWAYFSQYSAMMVILSLALLILRDFSSVQTLEKWVWVIPGLAYAAFSWGNYRALALTLDELRVLRGVAISQSGLDLKGVEPAVSKRFHLAMILFVLVMYSAAWAYI